MKKSAMLRPFAAVAAAALVAIAGWWAGAGPARASAFPSEFREAAPDGKDPAVKGSFFQAGPASAFGLALATNQDDFDVTHYRLALTFTPATEIVSGTVTITGRSLVPTLTRLDLDFYDNMTVTDVRTGATSSSSPARATS